MVGGFKSLRNKSLIEVGCGRGGCLKYIVREYAPKSTIGVDISQENINFCNETFMTTTHQAKPIQGDVRFVLGDSQKLTEALTHFSETEDRRITETADVVMNVESSHCYPDLDAFFSGVSEALKDENSVFLYTDFRYITEYGKVQQAVRRHFEVIKEEDLTRNVFRSL